MITTRFTFHQPPHNFAPGTLKTFLFLGDSFTRTQEKRETQKNGEWVLLANTNKCKSNSMFVALQWKESVEIVHCDHKQ